MYVAKLMAMASVALMVVACGSPNRRESQCARNRRRRLQPLNFSGSTTRKPLNWRSEPQNIERRWTEMTAKVKEKSATPTAGLRAEVPGGHHKSPRRRGRPEDDDGRQLVGTPRASDGACCGRRRGRRAAVCQDQTSCPAQPETAANAGPFRIATGSIRHPAASESRLDGGTTEERTRSAAVETELEDTRARVNKLKEDVGRLGRASADDWWDISSKRVSEYIERVERSVERAGQR